MIPSRFRCADDGKNRVFLESLQLGISVIRIRVIPLALRFDAKAKKDSESSDAEKTDHQHANNAMEATIDLFFRGEGIRQFARCATQYQMITFDFHGRHGVENGAENWIFL